MMDFNLILLLVGLGLLNLVAVFVLLGCFAGLKKELKCTAIAFVLLLLALLVFGNSSTLLDANGSLLKSFIKGIPASAVSIWDCVLALVQNAVPGGAEIFAEGTKSYAFLYSVVGGVARGALLIIGTFAMFIISMITLGIYRLVTRIKACKKARLRAAEGYKEPEPEVEGANENVLVTQGQAGEAEGTMITANKEPVVRKKSQHRVWAGALAGLRAIIVIFFLFAPVSGITSVLDSISPETEKVINEALGGNQQNTAAGDTILDIAIDFKDAYYDSALGKFVEGSQFFFGESFSTKLFDGAFKIDTDYNSIKVREEAIVIIEAVNKLEGNTKLDALTEVQVANVLDALKDSKLIVEAMPVAIEVAYYYPLNYNGSIKFMGTNASLKDFLFASNQQAAFLQLRQLDWDKNIEVLLDVVAEAYRLGFLEEDFNVLTMDPEVLRSTLAELAKSDAVNSILNIAIQVALKHEAVTNIVGPLPAANLSNFNWGQEYETIVGIYEDFQQFGVTSLQGLDAKALIEDILNDEAKLETVVSLVEKVTELQLVNEVAYEAAIGYVSNIQLIKDSGADIVAQVKKLADLDWSKDINTYVEAVKLALPLIEIEEGLKIKADYLNLDAAVLETVMDTLLSTESFTEVLPIATNIALSLPAVQKMLGNQEVVINTANVNWNKDFTSLVNIYRTFQELDIETLEQLTKDPLGLVKDIFAEKGKVESVNSLLAQLADLTLFTEIAAPVGNAAVGKIINDKAPKFGGLLDLTALSEEEWKNDFESLVAIAQNVYEICGFNFKTSQIDFVELSGPAGQETLELLFGLNLLGGNQNKTDLVAAALVQFKVLDQETVDELDFSNVVWLSEEEYSEVNVFKQLFALVARISKLEGVDLANLKFDYNEILSRDDSYELIVDVLDVVVESELVLELLPSVLDKYVVPLVKNFEDEDGTLKDIITGLESEVLIAEIQKLVDVAKAVVELNVLEVSKSGIQALDLANTEAMKTAINGIFDSKLLEGYESRVVRILLKVTKLFPNLEKGIFDEVDFDREQALLIQVIEDLEVILQDENFLTFDENGKIKLDPLYFTKDAQLDALLSALKTLFGEYQGVTVSEGSALVEILLPQVFGKFVTPVMPKQIEGLMDILNIENQHSRTLAEDVRKVIYIAETLIDVKVQSYLEQKDYNFAGAADAIQTVLSTVFDLGMIQGQEAEVIAWALNYVQQTAKLDVAEFTAKDFAGVDWDLEVEAINELIADLIKFTNNNKISSVKSLTNFFKEKGFLKDEFFTTHNYNVLFELIEDVFALQTVEQILPFGLEYALNIAKEKQIDVTFLGDNMTGELLVEDVKSIVEALKIAVYDVEILEYKKANWTGELPAVEQLVEILDIIMNLNVLDGKYNQLLSFAVNKFLPANNFIKASDFSFDTQYNFLEDWAIIKEVLPVVYDLIHANNITKIEEVKAFVTEKWFANTDLVKDYNLLLAADLLDLLSETQLVQQALVGVIKNVIKSEALTKIGNFASLQDLTKPELVSDIHTLTDVVRQAIDANVLQYYELHDLDPINYEAFAGILETVGKLNVINKCGAKILPEVVNYVLGKNDKLNIDYEFTQADFAVIDWATETELLGDVLVKVGALAESLNLDSLSDILLFINNKDFTNTIVVTEENINKVIEIADIAVDSKIIQAVAVAGVDFALDFAKTKGFDVTFLKGRLTGEELISDLNVIVEIAQNAVDFGAIEFLNTKNIEDINVDYVVEIVALLEQLNILTCAQPEWAAFVVGKVAPLLKLDINPLVSDYNYIDFAAENELLQEVVKLAGELLDNVNIHSIEEIKAYISNKDFLNINTYNDRVIDNVQSLLLVAAESDLLGVHLVDLVEYAAKVGGNIAKLDLSFVNNVFTRSEIQADLVTLVDIIDLVEEFGIVDLIFTGDVVINLDPAIEAVALLEELNLLNKTNDYIAELVFNMILPKLGLNKVHVADFKAINFAAENAVLVSALEEVKVLCEAEGFDTVSEVIRFVKNREFLYIDKYEQVYSDEAILSVERLVEIITTSELVKLELVPLFNMAISKVPAQFDVQFLKDSVTADELANDLNVLVDIAKLAVDFGAVEYIFTKDIAEINVNYVAEAVALFEELNILTNNNKEIAAFAFNFVYEKLGINQNKRAAKVQAADFENINFASENAKLQEVIALIGEIKTDLQLNSLSDVMNFVNNKEYANFEEFTALTYTHAEELIGVLVDTELAQYALPTVFDFALDKVAAKGLDFSYLSGQFTGAELANDVKVLVSEAVRWVRNNGIITAIKNKEIQANYVDELAITVRALKDVNIVNKEQAKLVTFITNALYKNVFKYSESIDESYFANVDWTAEIDAVADVLVELGDIVETFGVKHNLLSLEGLKGFAQIAKDTTIYDQEFVANVADVLKAITKSDALLVEAQFGLEYGIAFASMKGIDATAIEVTNEELAADLVELSDVLVKVVDANVLGFALAGEALNQDKFAGLVEAVQAVLDLNIVQDIRTELLNFAFGKVGLVVEEDKLEAINWNEEIDVIGELLYAANDALNTLEVYTLSDIKGINVKEYLTINYQTNDILEAVAGLLEVAIESQLVETVLFPVSEKFLAAENLAGLGDLHNIYANFDEVAEDVEKVIAIIEAVVDLNVCSFVVEGSDIPYANTAAVEKILTNAFALNYLNNDGRLNQLISKFVKINTESIDFSQINLEADADKLVEAYKELLPILTDDKFFAKNKEDFKKVVINLKYWAKPLFTNALKDALVNVLDTTLVEETNGAIFLFTIPLLKKAAPDYYDAIDPESLTAEQLSEDFNEIIDLVELILSSNVSDLLAGKFFTAEGEEIVVAVIETLLNLNLLEGKFDDIVNVTADRFDAKRIGSYYFDKSAYNLTDVQYEQDLETIIDIIGVAFDVLEDECLTTLKEVKGFFSNKRNVKGLLADQSQFAKLEEIAQLVLDLTIVKYNALPVYTEALQPVVAKVIGAELADLAAVYDSSEELVAELEVILEAASLVEDFGAFEIIEGAEINYDQAALVKEILNKVASLEYLEANKQNLLEFVDSKVSQDLSQIDLTSMDLQNDFAILGEIYEQLIPVLVSKYNPFTTLNSIKKPELVKSDLYALIYDYQTIYPSVVVLASDISIAPQLVKFAVSKAKLSGKVAEYVDVLAIADMSDAEIREDLVVFADILTHAINLDVLAKVLYKEDIAITDNTTISALAASAFELNMVDNNFVELLEKVLTEIVKIDLTNVDLAAIDAEAEQALVVELVNKLVVVLNAVGVDTLSEVKPYISETLTAVKADVSEAKELLKEKSYRKAVKALVETFISEGSQVGAELCLEVFDQLCESQLLVKLALPVYEQKVAGKLGAELADLGYYSEAHFEADLVVINNIVHNVYNSKLYEALTIKELPGEECVPYLEEIIADVCQLYIVDVQVEKLDIVLEKVFGDHIDLNAINFSIIDLREDAEEFAALAQYGYTLLVEILNNGLNRNLVFNTVAYNAVVNAYEGAIETTLVQAIAPQVIKATASLAAEKLGGTVASVINALDIEGIYDTRLLQDLPVYAEILRGLEEVDAYSYLLNKEDIAITNADAIAKLAENAFSLVIVDHNFEELLTKVLERILGVDLSAVNMNAIDYEAEQAILVELVRNGVVAANDLGVDQLSEVKPYLRNTLSAVKADVKEAIELIKAKQIKPAVKALVNTAMDEIRKLNGQVCLNIVDLVAESELVAKLILPVYEQKVYTRLDGILAVIGDVSNYNETLLVEDLDLLAEIAHDMYDSKLYKAISVRELPGEEAIPYLENILRNAASLNIVDVKKADVLVVAQAVLDKVGLTSYIRKLDADFDLAKYDASSINFKADADIYASMAQYLYVAAEGLLESGFNASFFGNTEAINALVEVYTISIDTTLVRTFASKALNAVSKLAAKFKSTVNENDVEVLYNISDFLFGAIELGVFSNNGIDFTDAATIQMMKECVFDSVTLPGKVQSLINKVCNRAYAYGVVPFDWNQVSLTHEAKVYYNLAKQAVRFVKANAASIKALDLSILADAKVQADLTAMANKASESSIVQQLFFPFVEGTFKALTLSYTDGEMTYDATINDVLTYSLPNFWKVINAVYDLTGFKVSGISLANILANLDAVSEIVEVFGTDIMLKDNAAKILATAIGVLTSHDLTAEQIAKLEAIDFTNEVQYSNKFFEILADTYAAHPFTIGVDMFKDKDVILGVADALEAILPSETVKVLARTGLEIVNNRLASKLLPEASALAASRLDDATFTDEQVIADLYILVDVLRNAANSGILENRTDFAQWNFAAIKAIVNDLFDTNLANGYEAEFSEACIVRVPVISGYYDSSMVIADWEAEIITILNAIESLVNDGVTDMNNLSVDNLSGATVEYICDSVILSDILVDTVNDKLEALGVADYYVATQAKLNAVVDWDAELAAIKDLNNLLDSLNNGTYVLADVVAKYENIKANTVLVNEVLTSSAEYMVPKMPVVKDYYNSSMVIADWAVELDAIVNAIKKLDSMGLDAMSDPIENLTGEAVLIALSSEILKAAFVEEFNANLVSLGLGTYYTVTETEVEAIQTAEQWDKELDTIQSLQALLEKINNATVTPADLFAVKAEAEQTQIAKDIFESVLAANGIVI